VIANISFYKENKSMDLCFMLDSYRSTSATGKTACAIASMMAEEDVEAWPAEVSVFCNNEFQTPDSTSDIVHDL
jgi:hypothetical protein